MDQGTKELLERLTAGDRRALARVISRIEREGEELPEIMAFLAPHTADTWVVGLTGPPGVGKSTTTSALLAALRSRGERVGVLAVDPSSPFTGGAVLGDRVRMQQHSEDSGVFIRSMANRGHLGGLSRSTPHAVRALAAAGFDVVLVETVGVGQAEVEVAAHSDTTIVLLAPDAGDAVQVAKAGVLEIADVFVINKADRDGARAMMREVREMVSRSERDAPTWRPSVVSAVATEVDGVADVVTQLDAHRAHVQHHGLTHARRRERARAEIGAIVVDRLRSRIDDVTARRRLERLWDDVAAGRTDPYQAASVILTELDRAE